LYGVFEETNDIDIYVYDDLCHQLIKRYPYVIAPYDNALRITINDRLEAFSYNGEPQTFTIINGFQVDSIDNIFNYYKIMNRSKDQKTLEKIRQYQNHNKLKERRY